MTSATKLWTWRNGILAVVLATLLFNTSKCFIDPDLWGHTLFGIDWIESGQIPTYDTYSYNGTARPWINHELLCELSFGFSYLWFGATGLIVLKTAILMLTQLLIYRHICQSGLNALLGGVLVILVSLVMSVGIHTIRPQIFTYLFFTICLLILYRANDGWFWGMWFYPLIMALWINTHGGVLAGLGILVFWAIADFVNGLLEKGGWRRIYHRRTLQHGGLVVLSSLALLANPYGLDLPVFLFRTATVPRPEILEWIPIDLVSVRGAFYLLFVGIVATAMIWRTEKNRVNLFMMLFLAILPLTAVRHLPLFAIGVAVFGAESLAKSWRALLIIKPMKDRAASGLVVAIVWIAALAMTFFSYPNFRQIELGISAPMRFPVDAVGLIKHSNVSGNMMVEFGWGEYAIWHLHPQIKVGMDGRRETIYSDDVYRKYLWFRLGQHDWKAILREFPTDMVLVPSTLACFNLLKLDPDFELVFQDELSGLFAATGSQQAIRLKQAKTTFISIDPGKNEGLFFPVDYELLWSESTVDSQPDR